MTRNEKKDTHSEIIPTNHNDPAVEMMDSYVDIQHILIDNTRELIFQAPMDGYMHVVLINQGGRALYFLEDRSYFVRSGENIIQPVSKGMKVEWKSVSELITAILLFSPKDPVSQLLEQIGLTPQDPIEPIASPNSTQLSSIAQRLHSLAHTSDPFSPLRMQILALEALLCQLKEHYAGQIEQPSVNGKNYHEKVQEVKRIIEQDLSKNYTISDLAKEVGTNEQYIKKYFKQYFGKTVMNYVTGAKMEYAKRLIMTGEYRIADVAQMVGYKHSTHFTTAFKKYFGFVPNSLRYSFWGACLSLVESHTELISSLCL